MKIILSLLFLISSVAYGNVYTVVVPKAIPIGTVIAHGGSNCPMGTILANGATQNVTTYPQLAAVYGVVSGTFNLPDYRGYFLRGLDTSGTVDPDRGGAAVVGSSQGDMFRSHTHSFADYTFSENYGSNCGFLGASGSDGDNAPVNAYTHDSRAAGGNESRPKNVAVIFCVVTD
jgi:hypothetical protein